MPTFPPASRHTPYSDKRFHSDDDDDDFQELRYHPDYPDFPGGHSSRPLSRRASFLASLKLSYASKNIMSKMLPAHHPPPVMPPPRGVLPAVPSSVHSGSSSPGSKLNAKIHQIANKLVHHHHPEDETFFKRDRATSVGSLFTPPSMPELRTTLDFPQWPGSRRRSRSLSPARQHEGGGRGTANTEDCLKGPADYFRNEERDDESTGHAHSSQLYYAAVDLTSGSPISSNAEPIIMGSLPPPPRKPVNRGEVTSFPTPASSSQLMNSEHFASTPSTASFASTPLEESFPFAPQIVVSPTKKLLVTNAALLDLPFATESSDTDGMLGRIGDFAAGGLGVTSPGSNGRSGHANKRLSALSGVSGVTMSAFAGRNSPMNLTMQPRTSEKLIFDENMDRMHTLPGSRREQVNGGLKDEINYDFVEDGHSSKHGNSSLPPSRSTSLAEPSDDDVNYISEDDVDDLDDVDHVATSYEPSKEVARSPISASQVYPTRASSFTSPLAINTQVEPSNSAFSPSSASMPISPPYSVTHRTPASPELLPTVMSGYLTKKSSHTRFQRRLLFRFDGVLLVCLSQKNTHKLGSKYKMDTVPTVYIRGLGKGGAEFADMVDRYYAGTGTQANRLIANVIGGNDHRGTPNMSSRTIFIPKWTIPVMEFQGVKSLIPHPVANWSSKSARTFILKRRGGSDVALCASGEQDFLRWVVALTRALPRTARRKSDSMLRQPKSLGAGKDVTWQRSQDVSSAHIYSAPELGTRHDFEPARDSHRQELQSKFEQDNSTHLGPSNSSNWSLPHTSPHMSEPKSPLPDIPNESRKVALSQHDTMENNMHSDGNYDYQRDQNQPVQYPARPEAIDKEFFAEIQHQDTQHAINKQRSSNGRSPSEHQPLRIDTRVTTTPQHTATNDSHLPVISPVSLTPLSSQPTIPEEFSPYSPVSLLDQVNMSNRTFVQPPTRFSGQTWDSLPASIKYRYSVLTDKPQDSERGESLDSLPRTDHSVEHEQYDPSHPDTGYDEQIFDKSFLHHETSHFAAPAAEGSELYNDESSDALLGTIWQVERELAGLSTVPRAESVVYAPPIRQSPDKHDSFSDEQTERADEPHPRLEELPMSTHEVVGLPDSLPRPIFRDSQEFANQPPMIGTNTEMHLTTDFSPSVPDQGFIPVAKPTFLITSRGHEGDKGPSLSSSRFSDSTMSSENSHYHDHRQEALDDVQTSHNPRASLPAPLLISHIHVPSPRTHSAQSRSSPNQFLPRSASLTSSPVQPAPMIPAVPQLSLITGPLLDDCHSILRILAHLRGLFIFPPTPKSGQNRPPTAHLNPNFRHHFIQNSIPYFCDRVTKHLEAGADTLGSWHTVQETFQTASHHWAENISQYQQLALAAQERGEQDAPPLRILERAVNLIMHSVRGMDL
ncbi:hypothetical protein DFS34DRAFT_603232 [Phlyctochytrium arcticum]|nr:hypothetical protein DFS34DRAFT_603232 [Phlyctochytrium arcticum]